MQFAGCVGSVVWGRIETKSCVNPVFAISSFACVYSVAGGDQESINRIGLGC